MFGRLLRRWADAANLAELRRVEKELDEARQELREERSNVRILELEQENLLSVIERDRRRIEAETKTHLAAGVAAELRANHDDRVNTL